LIGALLAAAISLISIFVNNLIQLSTNKANIHARRAEMTLSKRLEAFTNLASSLAKVGETAIGIRIAMRNKDNVHADELISNLGQFMDNLAESYGRNSIYFPSRISESLVEGINLVLDYDVKKAISYDEYYQLHVKCYDTLSLLTEEIRLYLGEK
jgi:hypothetical protein